MTSSAYPEIEHCGLSETGPVREQNQDAIRLPQDDAPGEGVLYALADGMGGYACGDLASTLAIQALCEVFGNDGGGKPENRLRRGVQQANITVYQEARRLGIPRMGTTLTAVHLLGDRLRLAHVGDSRIYLIRDRRAICLTNDHTLVGDLVRMRVLSPDHVRSHAQRSILTKCVGLDLFVQPDSAEHALQADDRIVLCSDGVWSVVQDQELAAITSAARDTGSAAQNLINAALDQNTDDNVSVIAIHIRRLPQAAEGRRHSLWQRLVRKT